MRAHFVGVCGTGMAALAVLYREAGHDVSGSDARFDPPMGPALAAAGVRCLEGYDAARLDGADVPDGRAPDLVVVGNVVRRDNPEAVAVEARGLPRSSMSEALRSAFLERRRVLVVAGTHGKTTTSSMAAWLLAKAELRPGWFIGGLPKNLPAGAALGRTGPALASSARLIDGYSATGPAPFVVEGDEYDAAYFRKRPKFLDYVGVDGGASDVAILTSVEQDHVDVYPDVAAYEDAFRAFLRGLAPSALLVADARDPRVRALVAEEARCRVTYYALEGDATGDATPTWVGAPSVVDAGGLQLFDAYAGGASCGRFALGVPGRHNVRNAVAAMAACAEGFGVPVSTAKQAFATFEGVRRRQDLLGVAGGVRVYDDFAHHPTAVRETIAALRAKHPAGALWIVFEPRSATACRSLHQAEYERAFDEADRVVLAPLGRAIPEGERLDVPRLAGRIGPRARHEDGPDAIARLLVAETRPGDTVALFSNGTFGGLATTLLDGLAARAPVPASAPGPVAEGS